jgi:outer membrane beta-barrel protein
MRYLIKNLIWIFYFSLALSFALPSISQAQSVGEAIVVIQEKPFRKKFRPEFSLLAGWVPSNPFITYLPVEARIGFFISEGFGIEIGGGLYPGSIGTSPIKNQINEDLKQYPHFLGVKIFEQQAFYASMNLTWTPVHGKIRITGLNWIAYWEIFFQLGGGITGVYNYEYTGRFASLTTNPIEIRPTFNVGIGNRLWITRWLALKLDLREYLFQKQIGRGGLSQHLTIMLGLSFLI